MNSNQFTTLKSVTIYYDAKRNLTLLCGNSRVYDITLSQNTIADDILTIARGGTLNVLNFHHMDLYPGRLVQVGVYLSSSNELVYDIREAGNITAELPAGERHGNNIIVFNFAPSDYDAWLSAIDAQAVR